MRIDSLKAAPDRAGRYWITTDSGERKALYRQTIEDFGLYAGKELTDHEWEELLQSAGQMSAKMRAVRIVSASSVSKRDLEQRLVRKGEDPQQAKEAVQWMEDLDLLDDRKTAEQIVSRCIQKGYGLVRAKQALYEKRIPKEYWDEALADYPDQSEHILAILRSKIKDPDDQKQVKKAIDAALRLGHSYGNIRDVLKRVSLNFDEI